MKKSIIDNSEDCYICKNYKGMTTNATDTHHCISGSYRHLADADGLTVKLCRTCHRLLHDKGLHDLELKQIAERSYLEHYNASIEDFIKRYNKSWI